MSVTETCSCCHVRSPKVFRWDIQLCADRRRRRVFRLCPSCDVALNAHMLGVMGDPKAKEKAQAYAKKAHA